ncbi:flagellar assembly protein FliW [Actinoplanes sp. NBRC 103695]|uniref:flagellar assembly protein FliW n=1 Tax=Actinoplanes sp. NBRC 103695 TaxID=3032202 RepID=UPI0025575580|nr:flagellar assembly protein FliW [Actinoplanes sp. NBRC 103695]
MITTIPTIHLAAPMPGFPAHTRFALVRLNDDGLLYAFTSLDNPELRFLVVPPDPFFEDYTPEIPDEAQALLGYPEAEDVITMLVITAGKEATAANLMAPIVINTVNRMAVQVVLAGTDMPVRAILNRK